MIKVRPEHVGQTFKFKKRSLPVKNEGWVRELTEYGQGIDKSEVASEKAKPVKVNGSYLAIYCHCDGYPDGVGKVLKELFNDYDKAFNLVIGGDCSHVWFDSVKRYGDRKGEEWKYLQPKQGSKPEEIYPHIDSEYCYLYDEENGGWKVNDYDNGVVELEDGHKVPAPIFKEYETE